MKIVFAAALFFNSFVGFTQSVSVENLKKGSESHLLITVKENQTTKSYFAGCNFKNRIIHLECKAKVGNN
jgi:hypothetical protein